MGVTTLQTSEIKYYNELKRWTGQGKRSKLSEEFNAS